MGYCLELNAGFNDQKALILNTIIFILICQTLL